MVCNASTAGRRCHLSYLLGSSPAKDPVSKVKVIGPGVKNLRLSLTYTHTRSQVHPCPNCQQNHDTLCFIPKVNVWTGSPAYTVLLAISPEELSSWPLEEKVPLLGGLAFTTRGALLVQNSSQSRLTNWTGLAKAGQGWRVQAPERAEPDQRNAQM